MSAQTHTPTVTLTAITKTAEGGAITLCAPAVGRFRPLTSLVSAQRGAQRPLIGPNAPLGTLEVLGARHPLICPADAPPSSLTLAARGLSAVAYGQGLATLTPLKASEGEASEGAEQVSAQEGYALEAPIDGTVYYSPSPEAPPFVAEGETINPGQVIALVEVMKFFYEIKHEGDAPVTALRRGVAHGAPIEAGEALWFVSDRAEASAQGGGEA